MLYSLLRRAAYRVAISCRFARRAAAPAVAIACANATAAHAQTAAGTTITNVADAQYSAGDAQERMRSNADIFLVAERLDVALADVSTAAVGTALLTNGGNGVERFAVTAADDEAGAVRLAVDADDDGLYDPTRDPLLDAATAALPPGSRLRLFVVGRVVRPVTITAVAATGSGAPGTTFPDRGDGGGDAVVGATGARASVTLLPGAVAVPVFVKSQTVVSADGGSRAIVGAIVTYALDARFADATPGVRVDDIVPTGARYVAGSLRLDGGVLSDAADADTGSFDGNAVHVALGDVPAGAVHTITFQASLQ